MTQIGRQLIKKKNPGTFLICPTISWYFLPYFSVLLYLYRFDSILFFLLYTIYSQWILNLTRGEIRNIMARNERWVYLQKKKKNRKI